MFGHDFFPQPPRGGHGAGWKLRLLQALCSVPQQLWGGENTLARTPGRAMLFHKEHC